MALGYICRLLNSQKLRLLKALIIWSLGSSEAIQAKIKESYKQQRHDDDLNQPLSVQSWGKDGDKRRFWLVEGQDDTNFRLYRESNPALKHNTWRSVAGTIDELKVVAERLEEENTQASRRLHDRIVAAVPRFEASEDVGQSFLYISVYSNPLRNESVETIDLLAERNSLGQNRASRFMKVEHGESGCDIHTPMRKMGDQMLHQ